MYTEENLMKEKYPELVKIFKSVSSESVWRVKKVDLVKKILDLHKNKENADPIIGRRDTFDIPIPSTSSIRRETFDVPPSPQENIRRETFDITPYKSLPVILEEKEDLTPVKKSEVLDTSVVTRKKWTKRKTLQEQQEVLNEVLVSLKSSTSSTKEDSTKVTPIKGIDDLPTLQIPRSETKKKMNVFERLSVPKASYSRHSAKVELLESKNVREKKSFATALKIEKKKASMMDMRLRIRKEKALAPVVNKAPKTSSTVNESSHIPVIRGRVERAKNIMSKTPNIISREVKREQDRHVLKGVRVNKSFKLRMSKRNLAKN